MRSALCKMCRKRPSHPAIFWCLSCFRREERKFHGWKPNLKTSKQLCEKHGISIHTFHLYTRLGLVRRFSLSKSLGLHRGQVTFYDPEGVAEDLRRIQDNKKRGVTLVEQSERQRKVERKRR